MSSPTIWSSGHYEAVAERIAPIAAEVIEAVEQRLPVRDAVSFESPYVVVTARRR